MRCRPSQVQETSIREGQAYSIFVYHFSCGLARTFSSAWPARRTCTAFVSVGHRKTEPDERCVLGKYAAAIPQHWCFYCMTFRWRTGYVLDGGRRGGGVMHVLGRKDLTPPQLKASDGGSTLSTEWLTIHVSAS